MKLLKIINMITTLFPIVGLIIIAMWFFYETKVYFAIANWISKTFTKEQIKSTFQIYKRLHHDDESF